MIAELLLNQPPLIYQYLTMPLMLIGAFAASSLIIWKHKI